MAKKYRLLIERDAHKQRKELPGHVRQRIKRAIDSLADDPRPRRSEALNTSHLDIPEGIELRRIRLEAWRVIYAVNDLEEWAWIWGVKKRPPYDYRDLESFVRTL